MVDELRLSGPSGVTEPEPSGRLTRQLRAQGGGRRSAASLVAGAIGLVTFVLSLMLAWLRVRLVPNPDIEVAGIDLQGLRGGIEVGASYASYAIVYELGVLALLGTLGAVILRPDLASRLRLAAVALGVGFGGVVAAMAYDLAGSGRAVSGSPLVFGDVTYLPGVFCAAAAVVALVTGIWLAAASAATPGPVAVPGVRPPALEPAHAAGTAQRHGQAPLVAFVAGVAGACALIASMLLTWQQVGEEGSNMAFFGQRTSLGIADSGSGAVYLLGTIALLGLLGAVVARPELAARLRPAATAVGLGILGVLLGAAIEMREWFLQGYFKLGGASAIPQMRDDLADQTYSLRPGLYLGFGAVVALVGGVWWAASPAAGVTRVADPAASPAAVPPGYVLVPASALVSGSASVPAPAERTDAAAVSLAESPPGPAGDTQPPAPVPAQPQAPPAAPAPAGVSGPAEHWLGPVGHVDGLTVTPSDPIDVSPQSDILRG